MQEVTTLLVFNVLSRANFYSNLVVLTGVEPA